MNRVPFTILVSGAEKARYWFRGIQNDASEGGGELFIPSEWAYLKTGDYTIQGLEQLVTVERKSFDDLIGTLASEERRDRFEREHERMAMFHYAVVVIESDWPSILSLPHRSKINRKSIYRTFIAWQQRYGVPWLAMGNRELAEVTTFRLLHQYWKENHETRRDGNRFPTLSPDACSPDVCPF